MRSSAGAGGAACPSPACAASGARSKWPITNMSSPGRSTCSSRPRPRTVSTSFVSPSAAWMPRARVSVSPDGTPVTALRPRPDAGTHGYGGEGVVLGVCGDLGSPGGVHEEGRCACRGREVDTVQELGPTACWPPPTPCAATATGRSPHRELGLIETAVLPCVWRAQWAGTVALALLDGHRHRERRGKDRTSGSSRDSAPERPGARAGEEARTWTSAHTRFSPLVRILSSSSLIVIRGARCGKETTMLFRQNAPTRATGTVRPRGTSLHGVHMVPPHHAAQVPRRPAEGGAAGKRKKRAVEPVSSPVPAHQSAQERSSNFHPVCPPLDNSCVHCYEQAWHEAGGGPLPRFSRL